LHEKFIRAEVLELMSLSQIKSRWQALIRIIAIFGSSGSIYSVSCKQAVVMKQIIFALLLVAVFENLPTCDGSTEVDFTEIEKFLSKPLPKDATFTTVGYECTISRFELN